MVRIVFMLYLEYCTCVLCTVVYFGIYDIVIVIVIVISVLFISSVLSLCVYLLMFWFHLQLDKFLDECVNQILWMMVVTVYHTSGG